MFNKQELQAMCVEPMPEKAFFRPFICKGNLNNVDIFLAGINPATPIYPSKKINLDKYVQLLLNYEKFIEYYKKERKANGKSEMSRTRTGINSFIEWLSRHTTASILETNTISYPTAKYKLLKKEPIAIINRAKEIFFSILMKFEPSLIILHGKPSLDHFLDIISENKLSNSTELYRLKIENAESKIPLFNFSYPSGKKAKVTACRHFMYYGEHGNSFSNFKNQLTKLLTK